MPHNKERKMKIEHEELAELVPQKGKMFLLGRICEANPNEWTIESETKITENFMFFDKSAGGVPNYACFELIAQTVAAMNGLFARENNLEPKIGFILSVSNLKFDFDLIKAGETVKIKAWRETDMDNVSSFASEIYIDRKLGGSGKITAMQADN